MIFVKHGKVIVVLSNISMIDIDNRELYGVGAFMASGPAQSSILRNSMGYI
jgi:hypothetical protein